VIRVRLRDLAVRAGDIGPDASAGARQLAVVVGWACYFDDRVSRSGFEGLIHDLPEAELSEIDVMLRMVAAPVALSYYRRAVAHCGVDRADFERFKADPHAPTETCKNLMMTSVEYLANGVPFDEEIAAWLAKVARLF
jgi:hypothetical protein